MVWSETKYAVAVVKGRLAKERTRCCCGVMMVVTAVPRR